MQRIPGTTVRCSDVRQSRNAQHLFVRSNKKGRGVYTDRDISKGETVLVDPVISFKDSTARGLIHDYTFQWKEEGWSALALGILSIVNHSFEPNCEYRFHYSEKTISLRTLRHIKKGEEITMNYNHDPEDKTPMNFEVI
jgi:SET domain-containing protein